MNGIDSSRTSKTKKGSTHGNERRTAQKSITYLGFDRENNDITILHNLHSYVHNKDQKKFKKKLKLKEHIELKHDHFYSLSID